MWITQLLQGSFIQQLTRSEHIPQARHCRGHQVHSCEQKRQSFWSRGAYIIKILDICNTLAQNFTSSVYLGGILKISTKNIYVKKCLLQYCYWTRLVFAHRPESQTARQQDCSRERVFNHKAAKWGNRRTRPKSASPKLGTWGYLWGREQGGLQCGDRWLEVRRGEVIDDVHKHSQTSCLFTGPMLTKWWCSMIWGWSF